MRKLVCCILFWLSFSSPALAQQDLLVGGGARSGVYYQVAWQFCRIVNHYAGEQYNCLGRPALGSVFNINAVIRGLLDFGVAQSDRNWQAMQGKAEWQAKGPVKDLRSVFSVHEETVLLVARRAAGITTVADLRGKRVNIGNSGSGTRGNAVDVLKIYGLDPQQDIRALNLQQTEAARAMMDGKIDAYFYTVGNPNASISATATAVPINIIALDSPAIQNFVKSKSYYVMTTIAPGTYPGVDQPITTYAVKATVVTSAATDPELVYQVVKLFFNHLDEFRASHKAFSQLRAPDMLKGLPAPLHPGAARYFKEAGLLPGG